MKKPVSLFLVLFTVLLLASCAGNNGRNDAGSTPVSSLLSSESLPAESAGSIYSLATEEWLLDSATDSRKVFVYPVFESIGDAAATENANKTVRAAYDVNFKNEIPNVKTRMGEGEYILYTVQEAAVTYESNVLVSIVYTGYYECVPSDGGISDAKKTYFCHAVNIDKNTGNALMPNAVITDFEALKSCFEAGGFTVVSAQDGLLGKTGYADIFIQYREDYGIYPEIYFENTGVRIITGVVDSLGSYAVFGISYEDADGFINGELQK